MKKLLVIVDMQNDFIDGSLGSEEAKAIIPKVIEKIKSWNGDIISTFDTHQEDYLTTNEGKNLSIKHCIEAEDGWYQNDEIAEAIAGQQVGKEVLLGDIYKPTFGSIELAELVYQEVYDYIELVGLCTDICVVSNALLIKAYCPEAEIVVDASCCAGTTPDNHKAALQTMQSCQVKIINN